MHYSNILRKIAGGTNAEGIDDWLVVEPEGTPSQVGTSDHFFNNFVDVEHALLNQSHEDITALLSNSTQTMLPFIATDRQWLRCLDLIPENAQEAFSDALYVYHASNFLAMASSATHFGRLLNLLKPEQFHAVMFQSEGNFQSLIRRLSEEEQAVEHTLAECFNVLRPQRVSKLIHAGNLLILLQLPKNLEQFIGLLEENTFKAVLHAVFVSRTHANSWYLYRTENPVLKAYQQLFEQFGSGYATLPYSGFERLMSKVSLLPERVVDSITARDALIVAADALLVSQSASYATQYTLQANKTCILKIINCVDRATFDYPGKISEIVSAVFGMMLKDHEVRVHVFDDLDNEKSALFSAFKIKSNDMRSSTLSLMGRDTAPLKDVRKELQNYRPTIPELDETPPRCYEDYTMMWQNY